MSGASEEREIWILKRSVRIWRKHGETQRLPVTCGMTRECFRRSLECFDQGVVIMNPTYPYIDPVWGIGIVNSDQSSI
jgi:hypothetical protein